MKILFIHTDYLNYKVKEKSKIAERLGKRGGEGAMEEPLIAFVSVEETDESMGDEKGLAERALNEIEEIASQVGTQNVVLFPFAHLADDPASPNFAISVLKELKSGLDSLQFRVIKVPFGWYKEFEFRSKGHPLSVLSRSVYL